MYKDEFENYIPKNEQEKLDKMQIVEFIDNNDDCLPRSNLTAHITSSAIVVNDKLDKVLFAYHNIYDAWGWVGGHNDGNPDLLEVALDEAKEETGVENIVPFSEEILMIDTIFVENHIKHGKYVPDHLHMNATYLLIADENEEPTHKPDENSGVKWFSIDDVLDIVDEPRMIPIYEKAFDEIKKLKKK